MQYNRLDDALVVARTCLKLDPYNQQVADLITNLEKFKGQAGVREQYENQLAIMENEARTHPTDYTNIFSLVGAYVQMQQTGRASELLEQVIARPDVTPEALRSAASFFAQTRNFPDLEKTLQRLTDVE